jgi:hypothetical protein
MKKARYSRAESLFKIRDLVALGITEEIKDRTSLAKHASEQGIFTRSSDQRLYSIKSIYRYLYALRSLKFDISQNAEDGLLVWSQAAYNLASSSMSTRFKNALSEGEKQILRGQIFESEARELFLACFCPGEAGRINTHDFSELCKPIYVLREFKRPAEKQTKTGAKPREVLEVEFTLSPLTGPVLRKPAMEFLYTYRLWCLDAGLIEEVNVKEAHLSGIPPEHSHVLYPVRHGKAPDVSTFLDALYNYVGGHSRPVVVPIVKLLYTLCIDFRMKVDTFQAVLLETWGRHRDLLHLERSPGVFIEGHKYLIEAETPADKRYHNHRYYLTVDGTVRSNLVVFPRG